MIGISPTCTAPQLHRPFRLGAANRGYVQLVTPSAPPGDKRTRSQTPPLRHISRREQALSTSPQGSRSPGAVDFSRGGTGSQPRRRSSPWEKCCARRFKNMKKTFSVTKVNKQWAHPGTSRDKPEPPLTLRTSVDYHFPQVNPNESVSHSGGLSSPETLEPQDPGLPNGLPPLDRVGPRGGASLLTSLDFVRLPTLTTLEHNRREDQGFGYKGNFGETIQVPREEDSVAFAANRFRTTGDLSQLGLPSNNWIEVAPMENSVEFNGKYRNPCAVDHPMVTISQFPPHPYTSVPLNSLYPDPLTTNHTPATVSPPASSSPEHFRGRLQGLLLRPLPLSELLRPPHIR